MSETSCGTITAYNPTTGVATVSVDDGRPASMHLGAFLGQASNRYPQEGDRISGTLKTYADLHIFVTARLVE